MRPIHNPTAAPHHPGHLAIQGLDGVRMAAREGFGGRPERDLARHDSRAYAVGGVRKPGQDETGLSAAEAVYLTRAHVLDGTND